MNRERARQLLPVIQAFADGEDIQFHDGDDWSDIGKEGFDAESMDDGGLEYRIKPKAREFWLNPNKKQDYYRNENYGLQVGYIKVREIL